ncbi:MAG: hypothetical protein KJT01_16550 [Gemmatimonadetes bacterium]|nr:hypothetical protein [Gemmatimonadota bacterium]
MVFDLSAEPEEREYSWAQVADRVFGVRPSKNGDAHTAMVVIESDSRWYLTDAQTGTILLSVPARDEFEGIIELDDRHSCILGFDEDDCVLRISVIDLVEHKVLGEWQHGAVDSDHKSVIPCEGGVLMIASLDGMLTWHDFLTGEPAGTGLSALPQ